MAKKTYTRRELKKEERSEQAVSCRANGFLAYTNLTGDKMVFKSFCCDYNLTEKLTLILLIAILIWAWERTLTRPCNSRHPPLA